MAMDISGLHVPGIKGLQGFVGGEEPESDEDFTFRTTGIDPNTDTGKELVDRIKGHEKENWEEKGRTEQLEEPGVPKETVESSADTKALERREMLKALLKIKPIAAMALYGHMIRTGQLKPSSFELKDIEPLDEKQQAAFSKLNDIKSVWETIEEKDADPLKEHKEGKVADVFKEIFDMLLKKESKE